MCDLTDLDRRAEAARRVWRTHVQWKDVTWKNASDTDRQLWRAVVRAADAASIKQEGKKP